MADEAPVECPPPRTRLELAGRRYETPSGRLPARRPSPPRPDSAAVSSGEDLLSARERPAVDRQQHPPIDEARLAHPSPGVARANIVRRDRRRRRRSDGAMKHQRFAATIIIRTSRYQNAPERKPITRVPNADDHGPKVPSKMNLRRHQTLTLRLLAASRAFSAPRLHTPAQEKTPSTTRSSP